MANVTVEQLAKEIGTPVDRLVSQLADSGVSKSATDSVSQEEKENLLDYLKKQHGDDSTANPSKMTLSRKKKSTLVLGHGSKAKSVQVEVRKKRTYVKRSDLEEQQQAELEAKAAEEARVQAEIDAAAKAEADAKAELKAEGKPEQIWDRILPGKMERFISDNTTLDQEKCLLDQTFIKDEKLNVAKYVASYGDVAVTDFKRVSLG